MWDVCVQVAGTVEGVKEPTATFSACFGAAFIMLHPTKYAAMLAEKMQKHGAAAWLVNTGWTGGRCGHDRLGLWIGWGGGCVLVAGVCGLAVLTVWVWVQLRCGVEDETGTHEEDHQRDPRRVSVDGGVRADSDLQPGGANGGERGAK